MKWGEYLFPRVWCIFFSISCVWNWNSIVSETRSLQLKIIVFVDSLLNVGAGIQWLEVTYGKPDVATTKQRGQSLFLSSYKVRAVILDQCLQEKLVGWPISSVSYETCSVVLSLNSRSCKEVGCYAKESAFTLGHWSFRCKEVAGLKCEPCFARRLSYVLLVDWTQDASCDTLLV